MDCAEEGDAEGRHARASVAAMCSCGSSVEYHASSNGSPWGIGRIF
jgi:hypothetical protein